MGSGNIEAYNAWANLVVRGFKWSTPSHAHLGANSFADLCPIFIKEKSFRRYKCPFKCRPILLVSCQPQDNSWTAFLFLIKRTSDSHRFTGSQLKALVYFFVSYNLDFTRSLSKALTVVQVCLVCYSFEWWREFFKRFLTK